MFQNHGETRNNYCAAIFLAGTFALCSCEGEKPSEVVSTEDREKPSELVSTEEGEVEDISGLWYSDGLIGVITRTEMYFMVSGHLLEYPSGEYVIEDHVKGQVALSNGEGREVFVYELEGEILMLKFERSGPFFLTREQDKAGE